MMFLICPLGSSTGLDNGYRAVRLFKYYTKEVKGKLKLSTDESLMTEIMITLLFKENVFENKLLGELPILQKVLFTSFLVHLCYDSQNQITIIIKVLFVYQQGMK